MAGLARKLSRKGDELKAKLSRKGDEPKEDEEGAAANGAGTSSGTSLKSVARKLSR